MENNQNKSIFKKLLIEVEQGLKGNNTGVSFGLKKLSKFIPNIQKKRIVTIAAGSGVGKTSLALYMYIYSAYEHIRRDLTVDYKCIFYTMEIDAVSAMTKLVSLKLFVDHKILVDPDLILSSNSDRKLPLHIKELIDNYLEYFEDLEKYVEFISDPTNPTGISKKVQAEMMKCGTVQWSNSKGIACSSTDEDKKSFEYTANNPKAIRVFMVDHSGCLRKEQDAINTKEIIDLFCDKAVYARNKYGASFVILSQLNRSLSSATRTMHTAKDKDYELLLPSSNDLKGTGNLFESSDIVLYAFNPSESGIKEFIGYNTARLKDRFRVIGIMKNRYGKSNIQAGYGFLGESNYFLDIPSPTEMLEKHYSTIENFKGV